MDIISGLPDESLIKILSFLPTKVAVSTSVLSKRWECLWMWLLKLEYDDTEYSKSESEKLRCFLHRSLALHKAPVLESLRFNLSDSQVKPEDINLWVVVAASRCIRKLEVSYYPNDPIILPSSLYTSKSLVVLKLKGEIIVEVPRNVCLPSLKTLQLESLTYACGESLQGLLSICPILEDLFVVLWDYKKMKKLTVIVPSLQRLTLHIHDQSGHIDGFVINTPSLEYFELWDRNPKRHYFMIENMPKLVEAYINDVFPNVNSFIGSMTSVKRLTLCYSLRSFHTKVVYGNGFVFNQLEHLKLCVCSWYMSNHLNPLLKDSPNLRTLELFIIEGNLGCITRWNEPTMVPECLLSSLQIFKWYPYFGTSMERDIAVYVLKNACCLETVRISSKESKVPKHEMLKELARSSRASKTCQLIFD